MKLSSVVSFLFNRIFFVFVFFISNAAFAYPEYIRLNYVSCNACHQNIHGGGLLSPYGKSIGLSEVLFPREVKEEEPAQGIELLHGFHGRMIAMKINQTSDLFPMQADYLNQINWSENLNTQLTVGIDRVRATGRTTAVVRKALIGYRLSDETQISIGRQAPPVGIYQDDHTLLIRSQNRRNVNDFNSILQLDYQTEEGLLTPYLIAPGFEELSVNREYGGGLKSEYNLKDNWVIGSTLLFASSPTIKRTSLGAHTRMGITPTLGVLFEYLWTQRELKTGSLDVFSQNNIYIKPFWSFAEFIEFGVHLEYFHRARPFLDQAVQWGPSLRARLMKEFSILIDTRWTHRETSTQEFIGAQLFVHI